MTPFQPMWVKDLEQETPESPEWLVRGLLPRGAVALLSDYPKVGKSPFAYQLAVAIATGRPFLGRATNLEGVLIIVAEERTHDAVRRLRDFGMSAEDRICLWAEGVRDTPEDRARMREFIGDKKIGLLIVDTLASYLLLENETDNSLVTTRLKPYVDMAHTTAATILLVHHERKNSGMDGDSTRAIRGGGAFLGLADVSFQLHKESGGGSSRKLTIVGRYSEIPPSLKLDYQNDEYVSLGTPEEATQKAKREKAMAVLPVDGEGLTVKEVAEKTGLKERAVRVALESADRAQVARSGGGKRNDAYRYVRRAASPNDVQEASATCAEKAA